MATQTQREALTQKAATHGLIPVFADPSTLQVDIDTKEHFMHLKVMLCVLRSSVGIVSACYTMSKSNHWHVYVSLAKPLPAVERYLLQGCLGSDPMREFLNYRAFQATAEDDCVLFEVPNAVKTPITIPPQRPEVPIGHQ